MKFGLAFNRPDDDGGTVDVEGAAKTAEVQIPDELVGYLKSKGLDPTDPKAMVALWEARGVEVKNAQNFRKRAQEAEGKVGQVQQAKLKEIIPKLDDEDRQTLEGYMSAQTKANQLEQSIALVVEAGVKMTPELQDVVKAGPEATRAALSYIKSTNPADGNGAIPNDDAMQAYIQQAVGKFMGIGADQNQRKDDKSQSPPDPLARYRKAKTDDDEILDKMRADAEARLAR